MGITYFIIRSQTLHNFHLLPQPHFYLQPWNLPHKASFLFPGKWLLLLLLLFRSSSAGVGASRGALSAPIYLTNLIFLHNFLYGFHVITCSRPPVGGLGKFSAVCSLSKVVVVINSLQIHTHTHIHMLHIQCRYKLIYLSGPLIKILFFFSPLIAGKCHQDEASVTKEGQGSSFALQSCQRNVAMEFQ